MHDKRSGSNFPTDLFMLLFGFWPGVIIAILGGFVVLPIVNNLKRGEITGLFMTALILGATGSYLLFLARLPLYRHRKFWTIGPSQLDSKHRRLYWLAYGLIFPSVCLLLLIYFSQS